MPGAPSEWCPEWYALLESAHYLGVTPWSLLGIDYGGRPIPSFWLWMTTDLLRSKANAAARAQFKRW